jgi:hypothetical protein
MKARIESRLEESPEKWTYYNITEKYNEWLSPNDRMFWIHNFSCRSHVVLYVPRNSKSILLTEREGIPYISEILKRKFDGIPDDSRERVVFAGWIKRFHMSPMYHVGSKWYWESNKRGIDAFLRGIETDALVFEKYCANPIYDLNHEENNWTVIFFVFKTNGGVDAVTAFGKISPFSLKDVVVKPELKAGTFSWPFYGKKGRS